MQTPRVGMRTKAVTLVAALALLATLGATSALAVHNDGLFELDTSTTQSVCTPITQPCGNANVADKCAVFSLNETIRTLLICISQKTVHYH